MPAASKTDDKGSATATPLTPETFRAKAAQILALPVMADEGTDHLLARLRHCGPEGAVLRREYLAGPPCGHESIWTPDGHGAYCRYCGETTA